MTIPILGFIGLGQMGAPIARKLVGTSYPVTVWARNQQRLRPFLDAGAQQAGSPAELAEACDVIMLCISDDAAVSDVVFGANGIAKGDSSGKLLIDHSTISAEATRAFAQELKDQADMQWVDAPVSGGPPGVAAKTLAVMGGGEM